MGLTKPSLSVHYNSITALELLVHICQQQECHSLYVLNGNVCIFTDEKTSTQIYCTNMRCATIVCTIPTIPCIASQTLFLVGKKKLGWWFTPIRC